VYSQHAADEPLLAGVSLGNSHVDADRGFLDEKVVERQVGDWDSNAYSLSTLPNPHVSHRRMRCSSVRMSKGCIADPGKGVDDGERVEPETIPPLLSAYICICSKLFADDVEIHLRKVDSWVVRAAITLTATYVSERIRVRRADGRDGAVGGRTDFMPFARPIPEMRGEGNGAAV
jgi:hypothetical protein